MQVQLQPEKMVYPVLKLIILLANEIQILLVDGHLPWRGDNAEMQHSLFV